MNNQYQSMSNKYKSVDLEARINDSSPHELIALLLQGARTYISNAVGFMQRNNIQQKGEQLSKAHAVIDGLRASLDMEKGGKMAANLSQFYKQIQVLLVNGNLKNDEKLLLRANELLAGVLESWNSIRPKP